MQVVRMILILAASLFGSVVAKADSHGAQQPFGDVSELRLLPGWQRADGMYMAAIEFRMAPGWKTYWRAPGSNGIEPEFDWSGSRNLAQVGYVWPTPRVYMSYGLLTVGYQDRLVLPVVLKAKDPNLPIDAFVTVNYGVCLDVCILAEDTALLTMSPGEGAENPAITEAVASRPATADASGIRTVTCRLTPAERGYVMAVEVDFAQTVSSPEMVIIESGSRNIWISEADHSASANQITLEADVRHYGEGAMQLDRSRVRITVLDGGEGIDIRGCVG